MIRAAHISVALPSKTKILDDVSFEIKPGVLTVFLGKNGAGKSTALKAACGDLPHATGQTFIDGRDQRLVPIAELAQKRAVVSQKTNLDFAFTVREVVAIGRAPFTGIFHSKKDEEIIADCLLKVDALHLIDRDYPTLSGGEQQRVQFARALAQLWNSIEAETPSYLLLDEPLASLDVAHQHEMMLLLQQMCTHNVGVLIVLHDLNLAAQYSDQVFILKHGKTVAKGTPVQVFTDEIISQAFDHPVHVIPHPRIDCPLIVAANRHQSQYFEALLNHYQLMHIEEFREFCLSFNEVTEEFPFDENTLVFKVAGKMFALANVEQFQSINLKCDPEWAVQLREEHPEIKPGYHMNKKHWNTVQVFGDLEDEFLHELIRHSHQKVVESMPKKIQARLGITPAQISRRRAQNV